MPVDLVIYAVVAAGLIFWLRSILGTRHGDERTRANPVITPQKTDTPNVVDIESITKPLDLTERAQGQITDLLENPTPIMSIDARAENGLMEIARIDRMFEIKTFLTRVQDAFAIIVESFAEGDRETLEELLEPSVFTAFEGAIRARESGEHTQTTDILAINTAKILDAQIDGKMAKITVMFIANETTVVYDDNGEIMSGHPDQVNEMRDAWVFGRTLKSRDPRWLVVETKGDIEDDNDMIPNTD